MSCNGCRVLRKGCSESCMLRPCLQWIESPESQAHATVFVAKFFGRAGLLSFLSNVPPLHRPALFQSLLYEACGRTVNPVSGAVGLLWSGNWHLCQASVDTVLCGGTLRPIPHFLTNAPPSPPPAADTDDASEVVCPTWHNQYCPPSSNLVQDLNSTNTTTNTTNTTNTTYSQSELSSLPAARFSNSKRRRKAAGGDQLHLLSLTPDSFPTPALMKWPETPSEESATTLNGSMDHYNPHEPRLLNLFV